MSADHPFRISAAPCDRCGYNGPGYYQSETHPCVSSPTDPARKPRLFTDGPEAYGACPHGAQVCPICRGEKPADEDEVAAREWLMLSPLPAYSEVIASLARFRATAREQGRQAGAEAERKAIVADLRHRSAAKLPGENDVVRSLALQAVADHYERGFHLEADTAKTSIPSEPRS